MITALFESLLRANGNLMTAIANQIHVGAADQIADPNAAPYIIIFLESIRPESHHDGEVMYSTHHVDVYCENIVTSEQIATLVHDTLQDHEGAYESIHVSDIYEVNRIMAREEETNKHIYRLSFMSRYQKI
jgi:hypothetical protein